MNIAIFYGATLMFIIGLIFVLEYMHESTRKEVAQDAHYRESLASFVNEKAPVNENVWSEQHGSIIGFALKPRGVLYGGMDYFSNQEVKIIIENADVRWLLARSESLLPDRLIQMGFRPDSVSLHRTEIFDTASELILYRLNPE